VRLTVVLDRFVDRRVFESFITLSHVDFKPEFSPMKNRCACVGKSNWMLEKLIAIEKIINLRKFERNFEHNGTFIKELKVQNLNSELSPFGDSWYLDIRPLKNNEKICFAHVNETKVSINVASACKGDLASQLLEAYLKGRFPIVGKFLISSGTASFQIGKFEIYPKGGLWRLYNDLVLAAFECISNLEANFTTEELIPESQSLSNENSSRIMSCPLIVSLLGYLVLTIGRLSKKIIDRIFMRKKWVTEIYLSNYQPVILNQFLPDSRYGIADPFLFRKGDIIYCFVEIQKKLSEKGAIACLEFDLKGREIQPTYSGIVLEENFHLSFPHVFETEGEYFMLPEQHESGNYWIYNAKNFPYNWERYVELPFLLGAVDPLLFQSEGSFYILASMLYKDIGFSRKLLAFKSYNLAGPWQELPVTGIDSCAHGRNAGLALLGDGVKLRMVQKVKQFEYGTSGVLFQRVTFQNGLIELENFEDPWCLANRARAFERTHHVNIHNDIIALDYLAKSLKVRTLLPSCRLKFE